MKGIRNNGSNQTESYADRFEEIPEIKANHFDKKYRLVDPSMQGKVVILFYRLGCGHCQNFKSNYTEAAMTDKSGAKYFRLDTAAPENARFMETLYDDNSKAVFNLVGVPTVCSWNGGKFYSMYGPSDNEPEYRSVDGVQNYAATIGTGNVTFMKR